MGVLSGLLRPVERRSAETAVLQALTVGLPTATGVSVTPESSLAYTAVLACVRVLAEGVASLPCILYERYDEAGREAKRRARDHALYALLHDGPNPLLTAFEFYEIGMAQVLLWGNFYAEIEWSGRGLPVGLWPLPAWRMTAHVANRTKAYELELDGGQKKAFADYQILHVPGFGYDGIAGKSMIRLAREAIGLGLAAERFGGAFFGNGARPGVVLEHPGILSDEGYEKLRKSWNEQHQGLSNAQRVAILEEGMKLETIGVPPDDAQFLQTRQFQRSEIASIFRVPPHMIGDLERATFSNIEQQSTDFYSNTLQPWLRRWEQRIARSLLIGRERARYFPEFLVDAVLRADTATRYQAYATGRQWGWLSVNDIRDRENMNPVADGDMYLQPLNMVEAGADGAAVGVRAQTEVERVLRSMLDDQAANQKPQGQEQRAQSGRRRLAHAHRTALEDAIQRVLNRETNDIQNAARRLLRGSTGAFRDWLLEFLEEHRTFWQDRMWATVWALALIASDEARREAADAGHDGTIEDANVELFTRALVSTRAHNWCEELRVKLEQHMTRAEEEDADALALVEEYLQDRREREATGWARDMSTAVVNAVAVTVWAAVGVQFLRWAASGNENCPYCEAMDGRTVGIMEFFVPLGGEVAPEGHPPLRPHRDTRHPPLHEGCDCMVVVG